MELIRYIIISLLLHAVIFSAVLLKRSATVTLGIRGGELSVLLDSGKAAGSGNAGDYKKRGADEARRDEMSDFSGKESSFRDRSGKGGGGDKGGVYGALGRLVAEAYRNNPPEYPAVAMAMGYQGKVTLLLEVMPDGRCGTVDITESSGHRILDMAALRAARKWIFFTGDSFALAGPVKVSQDIIFMLKVY
ncbi:MAG TPA: energy transducer TonB [Spirochaetota bacterium]|nr:energy transducer TonB [Spirochaetota bacterium]HPJ34270.1 energy transducer TonB [Spirochaetota bacterium]